MINQYIFIYVQLNLTTAPMVISGKPPTSTTIVKKSHSMKLITLGDYLLHTINGIYREVGRDM